VTRHVPRVAHAPRVLVAWGRAVLQRVGWVVLALVVSVWARLWLLSGKSASWWQDSEDYLVTSVAGWGSLDLWGGPRPPGMPALFKLVAGEGEELRFMRVQAVIAGLCWAVLAVEVARRFSGRWMRAAVAGCVLGLSLAAQVTMSGCSPGGSCCGVTETVLTSGSAVCWPARPQWW
jgi:hypothetical protein